MSQDDVIETDSGGSGKVFLVLGLLAGVAIGGGFSYYYFGSQGGGDQVEEKVEKKKPKGDAFDIKFERVAVPIYQHRDGRTRFIGNYFIDLSLQVYGEEDQISVRRMEPQLQHSFISVISSTNLMREDSPLELDNDKAAAAIKKKANEVLGEQIVDSVAILNAMRVSR